MIKTKKVKPVKKKTTKPTKALRIKAVKVFNDWIKKRDKWTCVTCNKKMKKGDTNCHAGHFIHGNSLDFDERNMNCQCAGCNTFRHGNLIEYTLYMLKEYSQTTVDELKALKRIPRKFSKEELEEIIEGYKEVSI